MTDQFDGSVPDWLDDEDTGGDLPDWLQSGESPSDADAPAEDAGGELPDWLNMPTADYEAAIIKGTSELASESGDDGVPDWVSSSPPPAEDTSEEQTYADWAREHMQEEEIDTPAWISDDVSDFAEASAADAGLSYEEWERQQNEAEYEATREPDIELPEMDMPDLLGDLDSGRPPTNNLAETTDYMPEWFMGVEELDDADAPDWLKGSTVPTGQFQADAPRPPTSPLDSPDDLMPDFDSIMGQSAPTEAPLDLPDFDSFMGEESPPATPPIRRLDAPATSKGDSAPLDLADIIDEEPEKPQIRRLGDSAPASDSGAISIDDLLLPEEDDAFAPPDLPEAEASSPQDEFGALFGEDADIPAPPDLPEAEASSPQDEFGALFGDDDFPPDESASMFDDDARSSEADFGDEGEPEWLQGYDADAEHAAIADERPAAPDYAEDEPAALATGVLPDWFGDVDFSTAQSNSDDILQEEQPATAPEDDFDLDSIFGSSPSERETARPDTSGLMSMDGLDDLVSDEDLGFDEDVFAQFAAPPTEFLHDDTDELESADLEGSGIVPDWVQQMGASGDEVVLSTGGVEEHFEQVPPVVLPNELRALRGEMTDHMVNTSSRRNQIDQGPLAGLDDALDIDNALSVPGQLNLSRAYSLSDSQQMRLNALEGVLEAVDAETEAERIEIRYDLGGEEYEVEGTPAGAPDSSRKRRSRRRPDRLLVMLVLLIFALAPFATEELHLAEDTPDVLDSDADPLGDAIAALEGADNETDKRVLVSIDYGPATAHELDPLLEAVLWDIFVHDGRVVVTGTNPLGLLHVSYMLESMALDEALIAAAPQVESDWPTLPDEAPEGIDQLSWNAVLNQYNPPPPPSNINYIVLRYLPGGAVGVRSLITSETATGTTFTRDFFGEDTNLEIEELDSEDFAFIVVVGERYDDVRIWAEQTSALEVDKFALVTAAAEPLVRPYLVAGQYDGMVSGIRGALMYDAVRNPDRPDYQPSESLELPDPTLSRWHSATLGVLVAVVLIAAGALFNMARSFRRRERHS